MVPTLMLVTVVAMFLQPSLPEQRFVEYGVSASHQTALMIFLSCF